MILLYTFLLIVPILTKISFYLKVLKIIVQINNTLFKKILTLFF